MSDIEACIWMGCNKQNQWELTKEKHNERGRGTMIEVAFINEANKLLPQVAERDRDDVLSILVAYVNEAKKEESSR